MSNWLLATRKNRIFKFYLQAFANTLIGILFLIICHLIFGPELALLNILLSSSGVIFFSYFLARKFVWGSKNPLFADLGGYSLSYLPNLLFSVAAYVLFSEFKSFNYMLVQISAGVVFSIFAFLYQRFIVFEKSVQSE